MPISDKGTPNYWLSVLTIKSDYPVTTEQILLQLEKKI